MPVLSVARRSLFLVLLTCVLLPFTNVDAAEEGPRPGKYLIQSYGASGYPLVLGHFTLEPGTYKSFLPGGKLAGEGRYDFDPASQTVKWVTGPFVGQWGGEFTVEREGKTHKIRLKRTTIATNSTDSKP
jgi:hypothetical protein